MNKVIGIVVGLIGLAVFVFTAVKYLTAPPTGSAQVTSSLIGLAGLIVAFAGLYIFMRKATGSSGA